jgi:hypothetical protein
MKINFNEKKGVWDKFVEESPQGSIFVTTDFLSSLNTQYKLVTSVENDKILAGGVVFFESNKPVAKVIPYTQYQGLLLANNLSEPNHSRYNKELSVSEFFLDNIIKKFRRVCFSSSSRLEDLRCFSWYNYDQKDLGQFKIDLRYTSVLNLKKFNDFDQLLLSVRKCRRQEYHKALKNGLEVEEISDVAILDRLHDLTYERGEEEKALLRPIAHAALKKGYGRLTCVKYHGEPIAANLFIFDDKTGYYLFGANHPDYRNLNAGTLLLMDAIRDSIKRNLLEVDFVGVNSPNRGDYKLSFGGELKPFFITTFNG